MRISRHSHTRSPRYQPGMAFTIFSLVKALSGMLIGVIAGVTALVGLITSIIQPTAHSWDVLNRACAMLLLSLVLFFSGSTDALDVTIRSGGMTVHTCYFWSFFVPWKNVVAVRVISRMPSRRNRQIYIEHSRVLVKGGLTFLHGGHLYRVGPQWQWLRGFVIHSYAEGYKDFVHTVQEHIVRNEKQQSPTQQ
jgi:hypothetical protein